MSSFSFILLIVFEKKICDFFLFTLYVAITTNQLKHGGLLNKFFCIFLNIPNETAEIANFHFSHYKSMETLSSFEQRKQLEKDNKSITFVEGNVLSKYAEFQLHPPYGN